MMSTKFPNCLTPSLPLLPQICLGNHPNHHFLNPLPPPWRWRALLLALPKISYLTSLPQKFSHIAKIKINQNCKTQPQIFDVWCKNVRWKCKNFKKKILPMSFFAKWGKVKWHTLKQTKSKNKHHFFIPTFYVIQLCFWVQKDSSTLKILKMYFVSRSMSKRNVAYRICIVLYYLSASDKVQFKGL